MIFIHGAGAGAWYWRSMMGYFAERGYACYAPDLWGRSGGTQYIPPKSIHEYIHRAHDFILRVVRSRHTHAPVIVGHSMGGLIVSKLAGECVFHRVVLITPAPPRGVRFRSGGASVSFRDAFSALRAFAIGAHFVPSRSMIASTFADQHASRDVIDAWMTHRRNESSKVLRELFFSEIHVPPRSTKSPMLVIGAGQDRIIHPTVTPKIAEHYGAAFVLIPHLGHMCPFESGWEDTAKHCELWLSS